MAEVELWKFTAHIGLGGNKIMEVEGVKRGTDRDIGYHVNELARAYNGTVVRLFMRPDPSAGERKPHVRTRTQVPAPSTLPVAVTTPVAEKPSVSAVPYTEERKRMPFIQKVQTIDYSAMRPGYFLVHTKEKDSGKATA